MNVPLIVGEKEAVWAYMAAGSGLFPLYYEQMREELLADGVAYTGEEIQYIGYIYYGENGSRRKHTVEGHGDSLAEFLAVGSNVHVVYDADGHLLMLSCGDILEFYAGTGEERAWKLWEKITELRKDRWLGFRVKDGRW